MLGPLLLAALALAQADESIPAPARATEVTLDFKDRPTAEIVEEIGRRAGFGLGMDNPGNMRWKMPPITLESARPVSLLEALDRLCEAASISRYSNASRQPLVAQERKIRLTHQGDPIQPAATLYVGAFRLGPLTLIEEGELNFTAPLASPAQSPARPPQPPADPSNQPVPDGPAHIEVMIAAEPGRNCVQAGPMHALVAVDESGRSLLSNRVSTGGLPPPPGGLDLGELGGLIRIPLEIPEDGKSRSIARLSGKLPLEISSRSKDEPETLKLDEAKGKTVPLGGANVLVREVILDGARRVDLHLSIKLDEPKPETPAAPKEESFGRLMGYATLAIEALDEQGRRSRGHTVSMSAASDELKLGMSFSTSAEAGLPVEIRAFRLEHARWELPFEFREIPIASAGATR